MMERYDDMKHMYAETSTKLIEGEEEATTTG